MKLRDIFALFTLSVIVNGAFLAAAVQPVLLSLGAMLAAVDLDVFDIQLPFISKQDEAKPEEKTPEPAANKEHEETQKKDVENEKEKIKSYTSEEMNKKLEEAAAKWDAENGITKTSMGQDDMDAFVFNAFDDGNF